MTSVPGTEGEVLSGEAVYPGETLVLAGSAQDALLVPLGRDVLLPLTLAVTVPPTQVAVEIVLTHIYTQKLTPTANKLPWLHIYRMTVR